MHSVSHCQSWDVIDYAALRADKKASSSGGFSFFSSSSAKFEEAHDLYQQAGNAYKMENRHKEAGDAFSRAAEMALKNDEKDDAANDFWTASKSYKKSHPEREFRMFSGVWPGDRSVLIVPPHRPVAVAALQKTIQLYKEKGRFRQAADRHKEIAAILQQEGGDLAGALEAFQAAGDIYTQEDASA